MTQNYGNIVLFGETGAGKSSIVNMIPEEEQLTQPARTSSSPNGCTFRHEIYNPVVHGRHVILVDTAGLNEGDGHNGTVNHAAAVAEFYRLMTKLDGGIDLLMFCMRGPRIKTSMHANWKVFHEIICKKKVPIVLIVTGLEEEEDMDAWWTTNEGAFNKQGLYPDATACITATRGKRLKNGTYRFEEEFKESQTKVRNIIDQQLKLHSKQSADTKPTVYEIIQRLLSFFGIGTREADRIIEQYHMIGEEAKKFKEELARG